MGLILIPEIVYVRDIYEKTAPRANTMFKLTYQAYILFCAYDVVYSGIFCGRQNKNFCKKLNWIIDMRKR